MGRKSARSPNSSARAATAMSPTKTRTTLAHATFVPSHWGMGGAGARQIQALADARAWIREQMCERIVRLLTRADVRIRVAGARSD
eukprot:6936717-Pyramimonas_sp.AAC.1